MMKKGVYKMTEEHKRNIGKANKGRTISEEARRKNSIKQKGKKKSEEMKAKMRISMKGNTNHLGHKHSEESKRKMSDSSRKTNHRGEKHYMWKGGISKDKEYMSWLKNKRNRMPKTGGHTWEEWTTLKAQYNWTCPCCKNSEPEIKLSQDHIIPLSRGGSDNIENIQPLCRSCNSKKHAKIIIYEK